MTENKLDEKDSVDLIITDAKNLNLFVLLVKDTRLKKAYRRAVSRILSLLSQHDAELQQGDEEC